jgi:hypothetical protein
LSKEALLAALADQFAHQTLAELEKQETLKAFHRRLRLNGVAIDRLLGLPDGTLYVPSLSEVKKLMT